MGSYQSREADFAQMAESGKADILFELGLIYATGRDGNKDMVAAHKWFNIAAYRGCEAAKESREALANEMTREEISQAQRAAREWITQH